MKILIVDDDAVDRKYVARLVKQCFADAAIFEAGNFQIALNLSINQNPDLLLLDYQLPGHNALELLDKIKQHTLQTAIVVISQNQDPMIAEKCIESGAQDYLMKEDITRIRLNTTLRHAKQRAELLSQLERVNQHKTQFLRGLSHDLATPLETIMGFSRFLVARSEKLTFSDKEKTAFKAIASSSEHALKLIEQIKDIDKIERGILQIDKTAFDVRLLLENQRSSIELMLAHTPLTFDVVLPPEPISLISDESRITQALNHLIVNAMRHTHRGGITVTLAIYNDAQVGKSALISVIDTGIGMTLEKQQAIAQQIRCAGDQGPNHSTNTGTGLYFCSRLMALIKGDIRFESNPGQGTRFELLIPLTHSDAKA